MFLVDIDCLSNGDGKKVYGGRLDAYSFFDTNCEKWFNDFVEDVIAAIGKSYYPVYRIADGELRFLFGPRINWENKPFKSVMSYVKYKIFNANWKTSWGEKYDTPKKSELKNILIECILNIANNGKLAVYWNENGLNAFIEYNKVLIKSFKKIKISINRDNYVPFHFGQALIVNKHPEIIKGRNVFFVAGLEEKEFKMLGENVIMLGANSFEYYKCSATSALTEDYTKISISDKPDIIFVAAGIGAAKVLSDLSFLNCPIIDIGSCIHLLSKTKSITHSGFFKNSSIKLIY